VVCKSPFVILDIPSAADYYRANPREDGDKGDLVVIRAVTALNLCDNCLWRTAHDATSCCSGRGGDRGARVSARSARAGVLYSNLGPGNTYTQSSGLTVDVSHNAAGSFRPTATGALGALELALGYNVNEPTPQNLFHIELAADSSGSPGPLLEDLGVLASPTGFGTSNNALVTALSATHPLLTVGTLYWIEAINVPPGPNNVGTDGAWNANNTGDVSAADTRFNGGAWQLAGNNVAFRVDSTVPEPASFVRVGLAAVAICGYHRATLIRKRLG
jgi:hypothetical protein